MNTLLTSLIGKGLSEILVFFVIAATLLLPWYKLIAQDRHTRRAEYDAREDKLLEVIKANSVALVELRICMSESNKSNNALIQSAVDASKANTELIITATKEIQSLRTMISQEGMQ